MAITESTVGASADLSRAEGPAPEPNGHEVVDGGLQDDIDRALMDTYGVPGRRRQERQQDTNRAYILDTGYAGLNDQPDGLAAYSVNDRVGSMVLAEGTGGDTSIEAAIRGFGYAMATKQTQHAKSVGKALGQLQSSIDKIPKAIKLAKKYRGDQEPSSATALGAQLFDNKLLINGRRPVFVYDMQTGECTQPNKGGNLHQTGNFVHTMNLGQHIIIMSTGRSSDDKLGTLKVRAELENILANHPPDSPLDAQVIANDLHQSLATEESQGALLVSIVQLDPWQDTRAWWKRLGDYTIRLPSTAIYGLAAFAIEKKRRQLYEAKTTAGRLGRGAAIIGDLALNAGFLAFAYTMVRSGMGSAQEVTLLTDDPVALPSTIAALPPVIEPAEAPSPVIEAYSASRVAVGDDPISHGRPSTVTNWSHDILQHYGQQEGLPQTEIDKLINDHPTVLEVNQAFYNDDADPNNLTVGQDPQHWLYAGERYSQVDQAQTAHEIVLELKHELGLDAKPPPLPEQPAIPTPTLPEPEPAPIPIQSGNESNAAAQLLAEYWAPVAAAVSAAGIMAVSSAAHTRKRRRRKRNELIEDITNGNRITIHNQKRRTYNQKLLASTYLPETRPYAEDRLAAEGEEEGLPDITDLLESLSEDERLPSNPSIERFIQRHYDAT